MKNLDKFLKDFLFRVGSGVAQVAKEKTAPIKTGNLKRDIKVFNATSSSVQVGIRQKQVTLNSCILEQSHTS